MMNLLPEEILQNLGRIFFMIGILLLITIGLYNFYLTFKSGISYVKRLHQIPCSRCVFFTGDYRLKCTVHPYSALTELAINCSDYEANNNQKKLALQVSKANLPCSHTKAKNPATHN